jgi:hypothetical protein
MLDCEAAAMYVGDTGHAGDARQRSAGSPMAILQLQKRVVFKEEAKGSRQKQYKIKFGRTVRCEWERFSVVRLGYTSFWCWAVYVSIAGPLVHAAI